MCYICCFTVSFVWYSSGAKFKDVGSWCILKINNYFTFFLEFSPIWDQEIETRYFKIYCLEFILIVRFVSFYFRTISLIFYLWIKKVWIYDIRRALFEKELCILKYIYRAYWFHLGSIELELFLYIVKSAFVWNLLFSIKLTW